MSTPYDPTIKTLVETTPEEWPALVGQPPAPVDVIDADIATVSGAADKVLRVRGTPPYLLHLEFQTGHDAVAVPDDLHFRATLLERRHGLLVRAVAVLLRPEADSPQLTGLRRVGFPGEKLHDVFRYGVLRVWRLPPDRFLAGGPGLLPLAPISAVTAAELPGIMRELKGRLQRRPVRALARELWSATYILLGLRYSRDVAQVLLQGVLSMRESTTYQAILEEGRAEGISQGRLDGFRELVLLLGTNQFGPPAPEVQAALDGITDVARLEALGVRLLRVGSWQELLDLPAPRRRRSRNGS
jgi:predicted transposase YdaD